MAQGFILLLQTMYLVACESYIIILYHVHKNFSNGTKVYVFGMLWHNEMTFYIGAKFEFL